MNPEIHAASDPDRAAYIMAASGQVVTYGELHDEASRIAQLFRGAGLQVGDHVAFCLENHPRFLALVWGAQYAGLYYTAMSSRLTIDEAAYIVNDCEAKAFITSGYKSDVAADLRDQMPNVTLRLMMDRTIDGYESYEAAIASSPNDPLPEPRIAGKDMLYSSGTTGRPKGIKAPAPSDAIDAPTAVTFLGQMLLGYREDMIYLSPAPLYHAAPLRFTMSVLQVGGTVIIMENFDAGEFLALIERYHVTHTQVVPTMFIKALKLPATARDKHDLSSLEMCVHAAAPCPVAVKEQMIEWWGPVIHEYYAGTEGNGFVYCDSAAWLAHKGSVGSALVGEIHIVSDEGDELPVGDEGTIYFSGGAEFEYHNDPDKTASSRHPEGWTTLGDIGRLDADGFLYLTDRKSYMIISGGVNIYPQESENILAMHPKVADAAVIGVPNEDFGEEVKAVVQPVDMSDAGPEFERELIAYCKERLADVKCPRSVDFLEELPRHPTGKLYKRLLKDQYWEGHDSRIV